MNYYFNDLLKISELTLLLIVNYANYFKMKKIYPLFLFLFSIISNGHAQNATPNAGFENWVDTTVSGEQFYNPENWYTLNPLTAVVGKLTCQRTTTVHSGNYAVELITEVVFTDTANGIISTGKFNVQNENVSGGLPYTQRPDSMYGWYEYFPAKGDSTDIQFGVYDSAGNTIGLGSFVAGDTVKAYKRFSVPITYFSKAIPDTSRWLLSSSNGHKSFPGSTLFIDDLGLTGVTGINTLAAANFSISVFPNPSSGFIIVNNPKLVQGILSIFTETGTEIKQFLLNNDKQNIDVHDLAAGNYLYSITNSNGENIADGKIILR